MGDVSAGVETLGTVVGRSFSFRLAAQLASAGINVAGMVVLGNALAADGYGVYAFYYALIPLLASLSDLGIGAIITREVARDPSAGPRHLGDALLLKGAVALVLLAGSALVAGTVLDGPHTWLVVLVTATAIIDFGQDVGVWIFRAHDRQDLEALLLLVSQLAWLAGIAICAALRAPLAAFLGVATLAFLMRSVLGSRLLVARVGRPEFRWDPERLGRLAREGLPLGLAMFTVVLYGRVGVLLLQGMAGPADVAFFHVGYMLSQPLGFISSAFNVSLFPSLARVAPGGAEAVAPLLRRAARFQFLVALPLTAGLFMAAPWIVPVLLRDADFGPAVRTLQVMSLGLAPIFLNLMSRYALTALDNPRAYLVAILAGLVVNVGASAWWIAPFGAAGACAGLLAGEVVVMCVTLGSLRRWIPVRSLLAEAVRPAVAAAIAGGVLYLTRSVGLVWMTIAGALAYLIAAFAVRALSVEDLRFARRVADAFSRPGPYASGKGPRP